MHAATIPKRRNLFNKIIRSIFLLIVRRIRCVNRSIFKWIALAFCE